jgi:hypothetical protein
LTIPTQ